MDEKRHCSIPSPCRRKKALPEMRIVFGSSCLSRSRWILWRCRWRRQKSTCRSTPPCCRYTRYAPCRPPSRKSPISSTRSKTASSQRRSLVSAEGAIRRRREKRQGDANDPITNSVYFPIVLSHKIMSVCSSSERESPSQAFLARGLLRRQELLFGEGQEKRDSRGWRERRKRQGCLHRRPHRLQGSCARQPLHATRHRPLELHLALRPSKFFILQD